MYAASKNKRAVARHRKVGTHKVNLGVNTMDNHNYTEYAFYLGSKSVDELLEEAEVIGLDVPNHLQSAEDIRAFILSSVC